jgi:hypothetical protein
LRGTAEMGATGADPEHALRVGARSPARRA